MSEMINKKKETHLTFNIQRREKKYALKVAFSKAKRNIRRFIQNFYISKYFVSLLTVLTIYFMMLHRLTGDVISDQMLSGVCVFVCSHII